MESHYPPGLFCPEREEEECRQHQQPLQQPPPPHQQHFASYSIDLPYHAPSQHQSEFPLDQPFRAFSQSHPAAPMLSMVKHDSGHVAPTQILPQAQPSLPVRGQRVKPSSVLANYPLAITQTHKAVEERNIPSITPHENVSGRNTLPVALPLSSCDGAIATPTCESIVARDMPLTTSQSLVPERNIQPTSVLKSVVESRSLPITLNKSAQSSDTQQQDQPALVSTPSSPCSRSSRTESQQSLSQQASHTSPPPPDNPVNKSPLLATLNLKKTVPLDLPSSCALHVSEEDDVIIKVVAKEMMEKGAEFGPIKGSLLDVEEGWSTETSWEICVSGRVYHYIDGRKTWMSHVTCAQSEEEQNMEAYQFYGEIYFRNTKVIEPGSELKVFYNAEYAKRVGIHTKLNELRFNKDAQKFECSLCKDLFTSAKLVLRHTRYEHSRVPREELFPIVIWKRRKQKRSEPQTCTSQKDSTINNVSKAGDAEFSCGTCEKYFSNVGKLREHESFHKFNEGHVCTICDKKETNFWTLAKHMKTHEPEGMKFKCKECNQIYNRKSALRQHLSEFHGHRCRICLAKLTPCEKHKKTQQASTKNGPHAGKTLVVSSAPEEPKDMLGKTTNYYERPFKCRYCSNRYSTRNSVKAHEREQHTGDLFFKCPHCEKVFGREYRLIDHLRTHEENRMYRCTLCPRTFASESALNNHQGEHNGLKPFKCEICGRGFRLKSVYHAHKRRMHQENPLRFFCSVCNKGFTNKGNFTIHERRHKGIRPFVCLECGKSFTAKHCLNTHMKAMHTEEKAFSCNICGKTFSLNQNYTYHMFKHKEQGDVSSTKT